MMMPPGKNALLGVLANGKCNKPAASIAAHKCTNAQWYIYYE